MFVHNITNLFRRDVGFKIEQFPVATTLLFYLGIGTVFAALVFTDLLIEHKSGMLKSIGASPMAALVLLLFTHDAIMVFAYHPLCRMMTLCGRLHGHKRVFGVGLLAGLLIAICATSVFMVYLHVADSVFQWFKIDSFVLGILGSVFVLYLGIAAGLRITEFTCRRFLGN